MDYWIKKKWYIYTVNYYLSMSKNEIPGTALLKIWMNLESIVLSEIS